MRRCAAGAVGATAQLPPALLRRVPPQPPLHPGSRPGPC
jgi:hypothetical protein